MAGNFTTAKQLRGRTATALVLTLGGVAAVAATAQDLPERSATTSSFEMGVPVSPTPVQMEGSLLLAYELHLTNFTTVPLTVLQVEVLDADGGESIADLREDALALRLGGPAGPFNERDGPPSIAPGVRGVVYLELLLEPGVLPRALEHRVAYRTTGEEGPTTDVARGGAVDVRTGTGPPLGPPLRGGPWAAVYHPCWERGHRRVFHAVGGRARLPHRFAIDWIKLGPDGATADGDRDQVSNWHGYGAEVLAVADGVVAATRDHLSESPTLSGRARPPHEEGEGNFVVLDVGDGRYVLYGHLQPGGVLVQPGDTVRRGQVIGLVGFTGSAGGPQLHFHVADSESALDSEGLPFEIDGFDLVGVLGRRDGPVGCVDASHALEVLGRSPWTPLGGAVDSRRTREMPAPNVVVDFGAVGAM